MNIEAWLAEQEDEELPEVYFDEPPQDDWIKALTGDTPKDIARGIRQRYIGEHNLHAPRA